MAIRSKFWEPAPRDPIFDGPFDKPKQRLTAAGEAFVRQHRCMPPSEDDTRADAANVGSGLKMTETLDGANRPIRTFTNTGNKKMWMRDFMSPAYEMLRLCSNPQTPQQNAAWLARRVTPEQLASGNFTLPEF
ncbi:hypothetical protein NE850_23075 [Paraburkholderia sp. USG1]|uniref:hypothetical protein n=1 Tax=Paraburkholderia sp. USG1 TaxID=2952268 RepID=UPI002854CD9F|nr:hypothetical protein [Paraburkholderia sp. USG1]MDR8399208.1 hypothetical protein [Paraburkholderia sp. USG1]